LLVGLGNGFAGFGFYSYSFLDLTIDIIIIANREIPITDT
jgi:hypothetical protein